MKVIIITNIILGKHILSFLKKNFFKNKINHLSAIITGYKNMNSDYFDFTRYTSKNLEVLKTKDINKKIIKLKIKKINPDIILVLGWSQLLNKGLLKIPRLGTIGYHPSDLPNNRGKHPLIWSIFLGLKNIYSTFFLINETIDGGKILSKKKIYLNKNIDSNILLNKIYKVAPIQLFKLLKDYSDKKKKILNKKKIGNVWRKRSFIDGEIDWRMSGKAIQSLVRALSKPYPNAHFKFKNQYIRIIKCSFLKKKTKYDYEPGKVINMNSKSLIKCYDGFIKIDKMCPNISLKNIKYL